MQHLPINGSAARGEHPIPRAFARVDRRDAASGAY